MKIIILAEETDNHTAPLKWALEQAGFNVICWPALGPSMDRQASLEFSDEPRLILGDHAVEPGDVVWFRRLEQPQINEGVAAADRKFAQGEYRWFHASIAYAMEMLPVRCINPYSASRFINNKAVQLALARRCGMNVPATLMSNSPEVVKEYVRASRQKLICKPFCPHIWQKESGKQVAITETFAITPEMLPEDEVLTYAPAIYQQRIIKQFDVRMVLMGSAIYSYALHNPTGAIDWRQDSAQGLVTIESIATPPQIEKSVLEFARHSGIVHGSLDFAVDDEGQWWFLEINESGQFLWLDEFNRSLHVQEKFLSFLTAAREPSPRLIEERETIFPSWQNYLDSAARLQQPPQKGPAEPSFVSMEP